MIRRARQVAAQAIETDGRGEQAIGERGWAVPMQPLADMLPFISRWCVTPTPQATCDLLAGLDRDLARLRSEPR
jgi:hypothetical protein